MNVTHLECALCGLKHEARRLLNLCTECGKPLLVRYDLEQAARSLTKESLRGRRADLWRYREVLPVDRDENIVSLGEGWTPLLAAPRLAKSIGFDGEILIKDESQNPTQSFKARVVLDILTGVQSQAEACRKHRIGANLLSLWKSVFLERAHLRASAH